MGTRPLLLGHRGARATKSVAENTLASFDLALAHGCDGFEFDVRLSVNGEAVIAHDPTIRGVEIAKASHAALAAVPRLREVLARYQQRAFLDVELKVPGAEKITAELLSEYAPARGYVVSSFLPEVIQTMSEIASNIPLGYICEEKSRLGKWRELPITYVMPQVRLATRRFIEEAKGAGKRTLIWTVNRPADMARFAGWGVDGIISDETEKLAVCGRG